jgi:hypothetical protein
MMSLADFMDGIPTSCSCGFVSIRDSNLFRRASHRTTLPATWTHPFGRSIMIAQAIGPWWSTTGDLPVLFPKTQ